MRKTIRPVMLDALRALVLRWLRVPHDPTPPAGAPASVRVFRASENFYKLRLVGWIVTQLLGVAGIVFWIWMLGLMERNIDETRRHVERDLAARKAAAAAPPTVAAAPATVPSPLATDSPTSKAGKKKSGRNTKSVEQFVEQIPTWLFWPLRALELLGVLGFVAQLPFTLAALRLDYELRWYIVTDRSLRIRSGIWRLQEMTMSFANIQQVSITRGPIQGLLKISDVRLQSAGGGGGDPQHGRGDTLHTGVFHGVDNAQEIRDLVLERLRQFRASGLGDPEDAHEPGAAAMSRQPEAGSALSAAQEMLAEARALRASVAGST
jgi:hypothetical protein